MKRRLTVTAAALSLLALGSVYAGIAGACEGYNKSRYTSAEPRTGAEDKIASLVEPTKVKTTTEKAASTPQPSATTAQ